MKKRYVVIGSSAAGIGAVSKLCTIDDQADIVLVTASRESPYNTCLLADYLAGDRTREQIQTKPLSYLEQRNISFLTEKKLTRVDSQEQLVQLHDGQSIYYDKLFLGLGTRARTLPQEQTHNLQGIFSFHILEDAVAINDYVTNNSIKHAVILGAGLSGVECSDSLTQLGIKVTLVERSDKVLPHQVDTQGAAIIQDMLRTHGVDVITEAEIVAFEGHDGRVTRVMLRDGMWLSADMVIATIGGIVNNEVVTKAGLKMQDERLVANNYMQTSDENIYAGGDMTLARDVLTGNLVPNSTWPDAMMQGMIAGFNMAGVEKKYPGVQITASSKFFDLTFVSAGPIGDDTDYEKVVVKNEKDGYQVLIFDNHLIGFLMVGAICNVGLMRRLLLQKASKDQLLSSSGTLDKLSSSSMSN